MPLGAASVTFAAGVNSSLQLAADGPLRGRVMALYSVVFLGSTPIGAPLVGLLAQTAGPRAGLAARRRRRAGHRRLGGGRLRQARADEQRELDAQDHVLELSQRAGASFGDAA